MAERKQMKLQLAAMVAFGLCLTVYAALHQNTILAIIIFVAQGTLGSTINAKFRNAVFEELSETHPGVYSDLRAVADISPKAAEKRGQPYPTEVAVLLRECLLVQKLNTWMPILEVFLFFVMQVVLFSNL